MTNSLHSPKNNFRMEVNFNEPVAGIGSVISYTANSVEQLKAYAEAYKNAHVVILKNLKEYPSLNGLRLKVITYNI